jgi:hypothetical protein
MRIRPAEARHSFSIYLPTSLYQKLLDKAGRGKINTFIKQVLEEKLVKEEQQRKEEFRQKLIADYQSAAESKKIQQEAKV